MTKVEWPRARTALTGFSKTLLHYSSRGYSVTRISGDVGLSLAVGPVGVFSKALHEREKSRRLSDSDPKAEAPIRVAVMRACLHDGLPQRRQILPFAESLQLEVRLQFAPAERGRNRGAFPG